MQRLASFACAASVAVMVIGCSSSDEATSGEGGNGATPPATSSGGPPGTTTEKPATCTPTPIAEVAPLANAVLIDASADAKGPLFLVRPPNTQRALHIVRPDGERKVLAEANAATGALARRSDGTVCAAWGSEGDDATVKYACGPDFSVVDTKVKLQVKPDGPLAFFEEADASAVLFMGKFSSLDGAFRTGSTWADADVMESSISLAGSTRALSGAKAGSPYCWIANHKTAIVESWLEGGSAYTWGSLDFGTGGSVDRCAVAISGSTLGVLVNGGGKAKFATAPIVGQFASPLVEETFDAADVKSASLVADKDGFAIVHSTSAGAVRSVRKGSGVWDVSPISLPGGSAPENVIVARENGREHIVVRAGSATYYQSSCN